MEKVIYETQDFLRLIQDDENKRIEFLGDVIKPEGVIRIDMTDVNKVLSCDGQVVILKAEDDNFETALNNLFINQPFNKDIILTAKRILLSISAIDSVLLLDDMKYLKAFLESFKDCSYNTWGYFINAHQNSTFCLTLWAVGL